MAPRLALSPPPCTVGPVPRTRIPAEDGEVLVVKTRFLPNAAQEQLLRSSSGTTRAVHNILLHQVRANLGQRASE